MQAGYLDSAREIREYFIPDFSNWKDHDSYQTAFQRLVKDLKAGAGVGTATHESHAVGRKSLAQPFKAGESLY